MDSRKGERIRVVKGIMSKNCKGDEIVEKTALLTSCEEIEYKKKIGTFVDKMKKAYGSHI